MDRDRLFLHTLDDLERRVEPGTPEYEVLMAAALLRKLLTDAGEPLVHAVNRIEGRRYKLLFRTVEHKRLPVEIGIDPLYHSLEDSLDPDVVAGTPIPVVELKLDAFLAHRTMDVEGYEVSVHELIDHVAHVSGAVHVGLPKTPKDEAIKRMAEALRIGGYPPGTRALQAIGRVVLRTLEPLREHVRSGS